MKYRKSWRLLPAAAKEEERRNFMPEGEEENLEEAA